MRSRRSRRGHQFKDAENISNPVARVVRDRPERGSMCMTRRLVRQAKATRRSWNGRTRRKTGIRPHRRVTGQAGGAKDGDALDPDKQARARTPDLAGGESRHPEAPPRREASERGRERGHRAVRRAAIFAREHEVESWVSPGLEVILLRDPFSQTRAEKVHEVET